MKNIITLSFVAAMLATGCAPGVAVADKGCGNDKGVGNATASAATGCQQSSVGVGK